MYSLIAVLSPVVNSRLTVCPLPTVPCLISTITVAVPSSSDTE